jgi:DNA-binding CsgD family transcriptional regulator
MVTVAPLTPSEKTKLESSFDAHAVQRFSRATTPREVGLVLSSEAEKNIGISGYNFFALNPDEALTDNTENIVYWNSGDTSFSYAQFLEVLPVTQKEFLDFEGLMKVPKAHVVDESFDRSYIENTFSYNALWRKLHIERQVALVFGTEERCLGFSCLTRARNERAFSAESFRFILSLRALAEQALETISRLNRPSPQSKTSQDILHTLSTGLPDPVMLFDQKGVLLWANEEAKLWLGLHQWRFGPLMTFHSTSRKLTALKSLSRQLGRDPTFRFTEKKLQTLGIIAETEKLIWRLVPETLGEADRLLFCVSPRTEPQKKALAASSLKKFGLTPRESEVAALAAQGFSMINIAYRLNIAKNTVHSHMKRVYRKLDVCTRAGLTHKLLTR